MTRSPLFTAETDFEVLKRRRLSTIDLEQADLNPDRGEFEAFVKSRVAEAAAAPIQDPYRALWKSLLVEADRRFAWQPSAVEPREVSLTPTSDATSRHATRVLAMVHELHKAGYQRIRTQLQISGSGMHWRCNITPSDNIHDDGYSIRDWDFDGRGLVARYTTADGSNYFQWPDARNLSARELAALFLERFPRIAERGRGRDWLYAGWLTDVLGRAERGRTEDLLYLMADWDLEPEVMRDWQPPPPIRD